MNRRNTLTLTFLALIILPGAAVAGVGLKVSPQNASQLQGGQVMPPSATPLGLSLSNMALQNAQFVTSGNNPLVLPQTPFQMLYYDPGTLSSVIVQGGLLSTGSNVFRVPAGSFFYVPILNADDSPPVLGAFPTSVSTAVSYLFDSTQRGASQSIVVDGRTTSVGMSYLVGPITTAPLQDGGGTHIITVGVFLTPLSPGTHSVSVSGRFDGALIPSVGVNFIEERFTYTVMVH
jgi:hypothetical protein